VHNLNSLDSLIFLPYISILIEIYGKKLISVADILQILKEYWGYDRFRPVQEDIINSVLSKSDTLALLPTGGGKSICFQVPAMAMEGVCIVVTPLIALMKDQVEQLKRRGIQAVGIHSGMTKREIDIMLDNCVYGSIKFLYLSPERLKTEIFEERVKKMKVSLIAIDEAHCISQWGYDFRPSYLTIAEIRDILPDIPLIALTATATEEVKIDIQEKLLFKNGKVFQKSFARSNLSYSVFLEEDKERKMLEILTNVKGSSIVYVRSRKRTQEIAVLLNKKRISADFYHAGLSHSERSMKQERWISGQIRVMVATNAFGMGIDKPDVRTVIHWEMPDSLEAYYQEAGRAGRDEQKSYGVLLYTEHDLEVIFERINESYPSVEFIRKVYQCLANYYKIAVGSSNMTTYDFDKDDFSNVYNLPKIETFYALKRLESEGFIQLNESFNTPSKIYVTIDHKSLYEFQIANQKYDNLIKTVSRMYGGEMFTNYISISEKDIAKNLNSSIKDIQKSFQSLEKMNVLEYSPQKDKPQIIFTTSRFDASKLPLNVKNIEERKKIDLSKANAVVNYIQQNKRCRTLALLDYFSEISDNECGICDVCIRKKKEMQLDENYSLYREKIVQLLSVEVMPLQNIVEQVDTKNKDKVIIIIRELLDSGQIFYDNNQNLTIKN
jgi:ATP-dependent DNA helicase RecQ